MPCQEKIASRRLLISNIMGTTRPLILILINLKSPSSPSPACPAADDDDAEDEVEAATAEGGEDECGA